MFGNEIRNARLTNGATQTEVAKATGIPQNTISWIELDKGIPNIHQCVLLAKFYKISVDELIGFKNDNEPREILNYTDGIRTITYKKG